ncbi:unnamed protein product [Bubo scandiacus]
MACYGMEQRGRPNSPDYHLYFKNADGKYISPFHCLLDLKKIKRFQQRGQRLLELTSCLI